MSKSNGTLSPVAFINGQRYLCRVALVTDADENGVPVHLGVFDPDAPRQRVKRGDRTMVIYIPEDELKGI